MKLKVTQVTYEEAEISAFFVVLSEHQLKPLLVTGIDGPHEGYTSKERALEKRIESDKRSVRLIVAEIKLSALKDDELSLSGDTILYNGSIGLREVKSFEAFAAMENKGKGGRKKK